MARPRQFDVEDLIRSAARLFAEKGYRATSISDLTDATGILRGSLYLVFPDKHSLMLTVLDRYRIQQLDEFRKRIAEEGLRAALWADLQSEAGRVVARLAQELIPIDRVVTDRLLRHHQQLGELIADGLRQPSLTNPTVARILFLLTQGMRFTHPNPQDLEVALELLTEQSAKSAHAAHA